MADLLTVLIGLVILGGLVYLIGGPIARMQRHHEQSQFRSLASGLGGQLVTPALESETARITGMRPDGIAWDLRVVYDYTGTEDEYGHHIVWSTDAVHLDRLVLVIGNGPQDGELSGTWSWNDGRSPEEMRLAATKAFDDSIRSVIDQLQDVAKGTGAPTARFQEQLSDAGVGGVLDTFMDPVRKGFTDTMRAFVESAHPVELPPDISDAWHAFAIDDATARALLTGDIANRLRDWHRRHFHHEDGYLRIWIGGPNLRMEARFRSNTRETYQETLEVGIAFARACREAIRWRGLGNGVA